MKEKRNGFEMNRIALNAWQQNVPLQKDSVHIRQTILEKLGCEEGELPMLSDEQYDSFLGYMKSLI